MTRTIGEKRVVLTFNPSGNKEVTKVKQQFAKLIDIVSELPYVNSETPRWKSVAMSSLESACSDVVKVFTAGQDVALK